MAEPYIYRALFPPHFTPRTEVYGGSARQWTTLELPRIRLMGVLWSFGITLHETLDPAPVPALRLLLEEGTAQTLGGLDAYATPILLRAQVATLLQANVRNRSATRMSLLAVDTIAKENVDGNEKVHKVKEAELGFIDGAKPTASTPLIVAPFGGQPLPIADMSRAFLPAMQLLHGSLRYQADTNYLKNLRQKLGLEPPETPAGSLPAYWNQIVLVPDGFCLTGCRSIPWMSGKDNNPLKVSGWFKATIRVDPDTGGSVRGLTPWIDPQTGHDPWKDTTRQLEAILRRSDEAPGRPNWLQVAPNVPVLPEHLFWQEAQAEGPLLGRIGQPLTITCPGLDIRLSDQPDGVGALSTLTIQANGIQCQAGAAGSGLFKLSVTVGDKASAEGINAYYDFRASKSEVFSFRQRSAAQETDVITLALPIIETAQTVRQASGLSTPVAHLPLDLLWTFTPVTGGWLHWPLPNAIAGNLAPLLNPSWHRAEPPPAVSEPSTPNGLSGALSFGNRAQRRHYDPKQRTWGFSLDSATACTAMLDINIASSVVVSAQVNVFGATASFDNLFLVTPFAQTPERLLPDHAERALSSIGLRAVSASLLRGIEAQLWQQGRALEGPAIRLEASVSGFKINANGSGQAQLMSGATVSLTTHLDFRHPDQDWISRLQPWMWLAHGSLPTVQTLPLAVTGAHRTRPSGVRALAPLVVNERPLAARLKYEAPLTFDTPTMAITVKGEWTQLGAFKAATLTRPFAPYMKTQTWLDEITMAVTTLPSVSLQVGEREPTGLTLGAGWGNYNTTGVYAFFRHDLALRDERYALASAPPAPSPDLAGNNGTLVQATEACFTPLEGNGPNCRLKVDQPEPNQPDYITKTNGWDRIRLDLNRRAALAALDGRTLLRRLEEKQWTLEGVFGEKSYALSQPPSLSAEVTVTNRRLTSIGHYQFNLRDYPETAGSFAGLPAYSDLIGLEGGFSRDSEKVDLRFGVADLSRRLDGSFVDQYGLASRPVNPGEVLVRTVQDNAQEPKPVRLVTLIEPIVVTNAGKARFWCADVPVAKDKDDKKDFLAWFGVGSDKSNLVQRANSTSRKNNHLAGFRWSLGDEDLPETLIIVDGLVFEAMELRRVEQTGNALPTKIQILGRLRVPVSKALPAARGKIELTLTLTGPGNHYNATLAVDGKIELPFAGPDALLAPRVILDSLPVLGGNTKATVEFVVGAQAFSVERTLTYDERGLVIEADSTSTKDLMDQLTPISLAATLPAARRAVDKAIAGITDASATLHYKLLLGEPGASLKGTIVYDLVSQTTTASGLLHGFSDKTTIAADISAQNDLVLDQGVLNLRWVADKDKNEKVRLFGGLTLKHAVGTALVVLTPVTGTGGLPGFKVLDRRLRANFTFKGGAGIELSLDSLEAPQQGVIPPLGYRLRGKLWLNNALSWPVIKEQAERGGRSADFAVDSGDFQHQVQLVFDGQAISPDNLNRHDMELRRLPLMVEAHHRLSRVTKDGHQPLEMFWKVYQVVWLSSAKVFAVSLTGRIVPASPSGIRSSRTGFAPLVGDLAKPLRAAPHVYHAAVVDCGGLAGPLAAGVKAAIATCEALAVEFSNHVLLAFDRSSPDTATLAKSAAAPLLLGLPAFGLWARRPVPVLASPALERMLASRPQAGKPTTRWLPDSDAYEAHRLPVIEAALSRLARSPLTSRAVADRASAVTAFKPEKAHRAVFQPLVLRPGGTLPDGDLPTAGTAFILSCLFADNSAGAAADRHPLAFGFAGSQRIEAADFFANLKDANDSDLKAGTDFKPSVYAKALRCFISNAASNLVVVPSDEAGVKATAPKVQTTFFLQVEAISRDRRSIISVATRALQIDSQTTEQVLRDNVLLWAKRAQQLNAPWASQAVLMIRKQDFGLLPDIPRPHTYLLRSNNPADDAPQPCRALVDNTAPQPQAQFEAMPVAPASERLLAGYAPLRVRPVLLSSDSLKAPPAPRLTATGVETSWTLSEGAHALLAAEPGKTYWLADRETVALRPFALAPDKGPYELTFALPSGFCAATPRGLLPASHATGTPPEVKSEGTERSFAPAFSSTTRIALRPGAWSASRMGLSLDESTPQVHKRARASELPVHTRQPRPPLLATNDRPRASSHEHVHVVVGTEQSVLVHGERAARVGAGSEPAGLDRAPRSRWASTIQMSAPAKGILRADWAGSITLKTLADYGEVPTERWSIEMAALVIGANRYTIVKADLPPLPLSRASDSQAQPVVLLGFKNTLTGATALEAVRSSPPGTPVLLELMLSIKTQGNGFQLRRRARFALMTGATAQGEVETPVYIRFDDPEYNDRLTSLAQVSRQSSPANPSNDIVLAADLSKLAPGERIEAALAIRPATPGDEVVPLFKTVDFKGKRIAVYPKTKAEEAPLQCVKLHLERIRVNEPDATRLRETDENNPAIIGALYDSDSMAFLLEVNPDRCVDTLTFSIETDRLSLIEEQPGSSPALQVGDILMLRVVWVDDTGNSRLLASLSFSILATPELTPNPASFALLTLDGWDTQAMSKSGWTPKGINVGVALYANGPAPTDIELVDPRDLLDGIVRRRAVYHWQTFSPGTLEVSRRYAVQKINAVGGTWLPDEPEVDWPTARLPSSS